MYTNRASRVPIATPLVAEFEGREVEMSRIPDYQMALSSIKHLFPTLADVPISNLSLYAIIRPGQGLVWISEDIWDDVIGKRTYIVLHARVQDPRWFGGSRSLSIIIFASACIRRVAVCVWRIMVCVVCTMLKLLVRALFGLFPELEGVLVITALLLFVIAHYIYEFLNRLLEDIRAQFPEWWQHRETALLQRWEDTVSHIKARHVQARVVFVYTVLTLLFWPVLAYIFKKCTDFFPNFMGKLNVVCICLGARFSNLTYAMFLTILFVWFKSSGTLNGTLDGWDTYYLLTLCFLPIHFLDRFDRII